MIVVARTVSQVEYGSFALAFAVYSFVLAVGQAWPGQILAIRFARVTRPLDISRARSACTGLALTIGCIGSVAVGAFSLFASGSIRDSLVLLVVALPLLLLQEAWRSVFIVAGEPRKAFINDAIWVLLQAVLIFLLMLAGASSGWQYLAAWAVAAALAAGFGIFQSGVVPAFKGVYTWARANSDIGLPSVANAVAIMGAAQGAFILIALFGSVQVVGALRGAQTLLGPVNIFGLAVTAFVVPEVARRVLSRKQAMLTAAGVSLIIAIASGTWGIVLVSLPDKIGVQLLGETWGSARVALVGYVVFTVAIGLTSGATAVMRAVGRPRYALLSSLILAPLVLVLPVLGVAYSGLVGAVWGLALAALFVVVPTWVLLARATSDGSARA